MRAAVYARVSTHEQDNQNRLLQLRQFAASQGWRIITEYCDEVSGGASDRPQFQAMFQAASRRQFDILLFWSLDRLSREGVFETLQHLNRLHRLWRCLALVHRDVLRFNRRFKDAVISILAAVAKQERVRRSERTRAGLERARAKGKQLGRRKVLVDIDRILALRSEGFSWEGIAQVTGFKRSTCQRAAQGSLPALT